MFRISLLVVLLSSLFFSQEKKSIVFFGDSITAGYGINIESAFPSLLQQKLAAEGYDYRVINSGLSGETTAGGLQRIDWVLKMKPSIFVLELGGNDGLRGLSLDQTKRNLKEMIEKIRMASPDTKILLAGMQIPPNLGQAYTKEFSELFQEIAESEKVMLIPFLLQGVGGEKELNLSDGIHPNEAGHKIVADTVWDYLKEVID
jgi:acyl-CoA thioesterase-1